MRHLRFGPESHGATFWVLRSTCLRHATDAQGYSSPSHLQLVGKGTGLDFFFSQ